MYTIKWLAKLKTEHNHKTIYTISQDKKRTLWGKNSENKPVTTNQLDTKTVLEAIFIYNNYIRLYFPSTVLQFGQVCSAS